MARWDGHSGYNAPIIAPSFPMPVSPVLKSLALAASASLAACSGFNGASNRIAGIVTPYQIDVVQGNVITSEQVAQLREGLPRQSVRDLLGTPLLRSVFHVDRWDYVFSLQRKGEQPQLRKLTVYFKDDLLERFDADPMPSEAEFVASLDDSRKSAKVPELEASEASLKAFQQANKEPDKPATPTTRVVPPLPSSYPPLEPAKP